MALTEQQICAMRSCKKDKALFNAAREGCVDDIANLIKNGANPLKLYRDKDFNINSLCIAARYGHVNVVRMLLALESVKINAHTNDNLALCCAAENGHLQVIQELLKIEMVKKNAYVFGNLVLWIAAKNGHPLVVQELLKIDLVKKNADYNNNSILSNSACKGHLQVVQILLLIESVRNNAHANHNWALWSAAENGRLEVVKELLKIELIKDNAHVWNNWILRDAAEKGHFAVADLLLGLDMVKKSLTPYNIKTLEENGFYAWKVKHSIITAIRGMSEGRLPIEIILPIIKEVYPEFSENIISKQIDFVDKLLEEKASLMFSKLSIENHSGQANADMQLDDDKTMRIDSSH